MTGRKKRKPRGPLCPVCGAVMSVPEGKNAPECYFTGSHENTLRIRARAASEQSDLKRAKRRSDDE